MIASRVIRDVRKNIRSFGLDGALRDFGFRAANKIVPIAILKGMTAVLDDVNEALFDPGAYVVRFATSDELRRAAQLPEWRTGMSPGIVETALGKGDEAVGCFHGDRLACVGWYARTPTSVSDTQTLLFDPAWVYMHRGYTLPDHRGRRLHAIAMTYALRAYTERGALGLISYVDYNNLSSLRSIERMGYRIFGEVTIVTIGGREFTFATPGCRPYGFHLVPADAAPDTNSLFRVGSGLTAMPDDATSQYVYPAAPSRPSRP